MSLADYCIPEAILCDMEASDKEDALRQLIDALVKAKAFTKAKAALIRSEVIARERQATTGIGRGVGISHARTAHTKKMVLAIGRIPEGIPFGAVDGERVKVILLLVSPKDSTEEHLAAMKSVVSIVRDPYQCKRLHGCRTPASFMDLITEVGGAAR